MHLQTKEFRRLVMQLIMLQNVRFLAFKISSEEVLY